MGEFGHYTREAHALLHRLITPDGILASAVAADNYKRIWSRDAIVAGIAGLLTQDEKLIQGLKSSLLTLASYQHELGMIPSNVATETGDVSYGGLSGRIDASTWFVIGCGLYHLNTGDDELWSETSQSVHHALKFLRTTQYNDKGWIYTPMSGNWADEYPVHGYTLYDNCLYIWALQLIDRIEGEGPNLASGLVQRLQANFWPSSDVSTNIYHPKAYQKALQGTVQYYSAFILPGLYDQRFDLAGNALALLLLCPDTEQKDKLNSFLDQLVRETSTVLLPAFWPVIDRKDSDWKLLESNYAFKFENSPGNFHNGGIWPVWNGFFCLALTCAGMDDKAEQLRAAYLTLIKNFEDWSFEEYHNLYDLAPKGKTKMAYTASGLLFMEAARSGVAVNSILFPGFHSKS